MGEAERPELPGGVGAGTASAATADTPSPGRPYLGWIQATDDPSDRIDGADDNFDALDRLYGASGRAEATRHAVSLRSVMPPICDQGTLQSCTAHATAAAAAFEHAGVRLSRLQIYYLSRAYQMPAPLDVGAKLHNAIRALRDHGAAIEDEWPYDEARVNDPPPASAAVSAARHRITRYAPLHGGPEFRRCLRRGYPFVIGMHHTDAFWSDLSKATGIVPTPAPGDPTPHAHAVCVIGYAHPCPRAEAHLAADDPQRGGLYYEIRNSVGAGWGDAGHFWAPAAYLEDPRLAGDAWTIRR